LDLEIPTIEFFLKKDSEKIMTFNINFFPIKVALEDPPLSTNSNENGDFDPNIIITSPIDRMLYFIFIPGEELPFVEIPLNFAYEGNDDVDFKYSLKKIEGDEEIETEYKDKDWSIGDSLIIEEEGRYKLIVEAYNNGKYIGKKEITFAVLDIYEIAAGLALGFTAMSLILGAFNYGVITHRTEGEQIKTLALIINVFLVIYGSFGLVFGEDDSISKWWGLFWAFFITLISLVIAIKDPLFVLHSRTIAVFLWVMEPTLILFEAIAAGIDFTVESFDLISEFIEFPEIIHLIFDIIKLVRVAAVISAFYFSLTMVTWTMYAYCKKNWQLPYAGVIVINIALLVLVAIFFIFKFPI